MNSARRGKKKCLTNWRFVRRQIKQRWDLSSLRCIPCTLSIPYQTLKVKIKSSTYYTYFKLSSIKLPVSESTRKEVLLLTEQFFVTHSPQDKPSRKDYHRQYRKTHPDKVIHWQLTSYANALRRAGINVLTDDQLATMLADAARLNHEREI